MSQDRGKNEKESQTDVSNHQEDLTINSNQAEQSKSLSLASSAINWDDILIFSVESIKNEGNNEGSSSSSESSQWHGVMGEALNLKRPDLHGSEDDEADGTSIMDEGCLSDADSTKEKNQDASLPELDSQPHPQGRAGTGSGATCDRNQHPRTMQEDQHKSANISSNQTLESQQSQTVRGKTQAKEGPSTRALESTRVSNQKTTASQGWDDEPNTCHSFSGHMWSQVLRPLLPLLTKARVQPVPTAPDGLCIFRAFYTSCNAWGIKMSGGIQILRNSVSNFMRTNINKSESLLQSFRPDITEANDRQSLVDAAWDDEYDYDSEIGDSVPLVLMLLHEVSFQIFRKHPIRGAEMELWVPAELKSQQSTLPKIPLIYEKGIDLHGRELLHYIGTKPMSETQVTAVVPSNWRCEYPDLCNWSNPEYCKVMASAVPDEVRRPRTRSSVRSVRKDHPNPEEVMSEDWVYPTRQINNQ